MAVRNQWFTGSLEASSPALSKAGTLALEPYIIYQINTGAYDNHGHHGTVAHDVDQLQAVIVLKYAVTDRLSIQALPSFDHVSNDQGSSSGLGLGDLPLELEYRFKDENGRTGSPSITGSIGINLPTGDYQHLSNQLNGIGSGAYSAKQGIVVESLFDTRGGHPVRVRLFASVYEPLAPTSIRDASVYGTDAGFRGRAKPGVSGQVGVAAGYAIDQRWVLALDVVQNYVARYRLTGVDRTSDPVAAYGRDRSTTALAPAVEYNWSANAGLIAGVEFSVAGRNTSSYIAPQIAFAFSF
ncbi:hypothetical protein [Sphingomonas glacialis]|uniref:hypothetical protein n=1 Tax=Sphingomonas glacialis TaxID=658225 RepID=UPI001E50817C|nr:hypothetical protein [Sphingomonas glacialis]